MSHAAYSVLMSLYAKEKPAYLAQALDSMLEQTVLPAEIVLVKDGPLTPELETVLQQYQTQYPSLFNVVTNEKNVGLGLALNRGLEACSCELVARMDTDDISKPARCEKQLACFARQPQLALVGTWVDEFTDTPAHIISRRCVPLAHEQIYEFAKRRSAFNHPTVMYRKSAVLAQGGYANLRRNQDVDLFGRMLFAGCKAENIGEALLFFRASADLSKRRKSWENTWSYIATIKRFWKMGYSSLWDVGIVAAAQTGIYVMPAWLQQFVYRKLLRR